MLGRRTWILLLGAAVIPALAAQAHPPQRPGPRAGPKGMRGPARRPGMPPPARKAPQGRPGVRQNMVDHLMSLPPDEQREFMRNNPRFQRLPTEQQQLIERRLERFNNLPEARREALRERFELFRQLPLEQQERARTLYRQWSQHPPERRRELIREFRLLRGASQEERRTRMEGEEFRNQYSESEQELLRGLSDLLPEPE